MKRIFLFSNFSGQTILDLGCGWGSVALFVAEKYPKSNVFALSNSATQKEYILDQAEAKGLSNLTVFTGDVSEFDRDDWTNKFDRIISIGKRNINIFFKLIFFQNQTDIYFYSPKKIASGFRVVTSSNGLCPTTKPGSTFLLPEF